ncbi:MAG: V-type ATP synthase subunit E [Deltaproteobacteria bacterium]|nr:V-type ATP synthase subunit E [Deltaproteobacteria bacterium]MBW2123204.1 V-type ATP synthase subunit E [Deltaproteobacteria bacterium]
MGFAELLEAIEAKGREERERILSRSDRTAKRLIEEAEARAKELAQSILEEEDPELELTRTGIRGESDLRKKRSLVQMKNEILEEAFERAREDLSKIRERGDYESILQKLGDEVLEGGDVVVYVDRRDVHLIEKILASKGIEAEVKSGEDSFGGLVVETRDGALSIHNTIESRLEKLREPLIEQVSRILFGGE